MNFIEWCELKGITYDDIMHNLSDNALKLLEEDYQRDLQRGFVFIQGGKND